MRWVVLVLVGCSYNPPRAAPDDASSPGDATDATVIDIDAAPGDTCLGTGNFQVCIPTPITDFATSGGSNTTIDTDEDPGSGCIFYPQPNGRPSLCVIAGTSITIAANTLFFRGGHPVVLFSTGAITIAGGVDVGSHQSGQASGAGANSMLCNAGSPAGPNGGGGGGGAGGSFGTQGGNGGAGGDGAGGGSTAGGVSTSSVLRGGCPGVDGGNGLAPGGNGEVGGGAILLLAGTSITVDGFVCASGAGGGRGTPVNGGGGGGGSGGMIAMHAETMISISGNLTANGGGGGGGAGNTIGGVGTDPDPTDPTNNASGGGGGGGGGAGASGAAGTTLAGNTGQSNDGAGGAGGGLGVIRILSGQQTITGTTSPVPIP